MDRPNLTVITDTSVRVKACVNMISIELSSTEFITECFILCYKGVYVHSNHLYKGCMYSCTQ